MTLPAQSPRLLVAGLVLTGLSGLSGEGAWLHMHALGASYGLICGAAAAHCILCPLSLALLAAGLASLAAACVPGAVRARATARSGDPR